ncbi:hypothetical protein EUX98_g5171 [Antrodiella citrinella]|uniref:Major facilitator superfamily (MFS) profile domain-containing protein n=1 Tax=Antrodiella citrinella TaxID=2447956 RepID=A0A4V3XIF6_9APHY|nr:hypothetical protein EUX98_g5171 [Antrodiella citrinella]
MASEETPLLQDTTPLLASEEAQDNHASVYERFTPVQKRAIVSHATFSGLTTLFVSGSFIPSIPQIALELGSTGAIISLAVSLSVFATCFGGLFWASYSAYYGRKPVYLLSSLVLCAGSIGVAAAQSVPQLMAFRLFQALGSASGLANSMGVISDIYSLEVRGTATGIFYAGVLIGPAIAPVIGGLISEAWSWRTMQAAIFFSSVIFFMVTLLLLPETIHPGKSGAEKAQTKGFVFLNPLKSLTLIRSPLILLITVAGTMNLISDFFLVTPVAFTVAKKYNISNQAVIGALLIPDGLGSMVGAPITGYLSDRIVARRRKARGGVWVPEDRLRGLHFSSFFLIPASLLIAGWATTYVDGPFGLSINLFCLFINGFGVDSVFTTISAYGVDILHDRSAEVTAGMMAYRGTVVSLALTGLLPSIETIGLLPTYAITAGFSWVGATIVLCVIWYGDRLRAYVDIGFSTVENN